MHEAINKETKEHFAVKYFQKKEMTPQEKESLMNEVTILSQLDHPNIIKVEELYEESDCYYFVCELLNGNLLLI